MRLLRNINNQETRSIGRSIENKPKEGRNDLIFRVAKRNNEC